MWEYTVQRVIPNQGAFVGTKPDDLRQSISNQLNEYGRQNWELVNVYWEDNKFKQLIAVFKRKTE